MKLLNTLCLLVGGACALVLSSCTKKTEIWKSEDKVKIVATTTMVADLARQIGGDHVEVYGLMDEGVDPHSYTGKTSDTKATKSADVVFYSGLHLEHKLAEALESLDNSLAVTSAIEKSQLIAPAESENYSDPHVWGDPSLWAATVKPVVEKLSSVDSENADAYKKAGDAYLAELEKLHVWSASRLAELPAESRVLVTSHDAFGYLSRAYGLEVRGIDGLAPGDDANPAKIAALIEFIKE